MPILGSLPPDLPSGGRNVQVPSVTPLNPATGDKSRHAWVGFAPSAQPLCSQTGIF